MKLLNCVAKFWSQQGKVPLSSDPEDDRDPCLWIEWYFLHISSKDMRLLVVHWAEIWHPSPPAYRRSLQTKAIWSHSIQQLHSPSVNHDAHTTPVMNYFDNETQLLDCYHTRNMQKPYRRALGDPVLRWIYSQLLCHFPPTSLDDWKGREWGMIGSSILNRKRIIEFS